MDKFLKTTVNFILCLTIKHYITILVASPTSHHNLRIFGGDKAKPGQFPFIVSINLQGFHLCGGSIINENWIVTAAHCMMEQLPEDYQVLVGTTSLDSGGTLYNVTTLIVHPAYNDTIFTDDIAVLKVDGRFNLTELVQIVEISEVSDNDSVIVAGWGAIEDALVSTELLYAKLTTLSSDDCTRLSEGGEYIFDRGPGQVCALAGKGISPCWGDSGGPLILNGTLVGIVSYAVYPCGNGYPDIYTRVSYYVDWINENIGRF
ncbi:Trypsin domain containing protein [Asbolus verrucosus]|uniref:Trypsin domain containing protein n=1 Tax=Asbolus verrucosus TaxID=1661398 RepID=A0A482W9F4_ASBVE|nr:Trypsin domain containing protein [Asbolus verrucosus]